MKTVQSVFSDAFRKYGVVHQGYQIDDLLSAARAIAMPKTGCLYEMSIERLEQTDAFARLKKVYAGESDVQCGMCWGYNQSFDGVEYHRASEVNIAVSEMVAMLGDRRDIRDNHYDSSKIEMFEIPEGTVVEYYATTLHLAPCQTSSDGFRAIVILPRGTNAPLSAQILQEIEAAQGEYRLLHARDKWLLLHPDTDGCKKEGIFPGVYGENLRYGSIV